MKSTFLLSACMLFLFSACENTDNKNIYGNAILAGRQMIDSLIKDGKVPGIDVAVYKDGDIVWSEGFGYADLEHKVPVIAGKTLFRIGSVSKPLSSAALGILMDNNKINTEETVQKYVPEFPQKKYKLTIKEIGGHIGGIRHYRNNEMRSSIFYPTVISGLEIFKDDSLLFEPGTDYSYSSYGFNLLSAVIESAGEEDFLSFIQSEVFDKLEMKTTFPDYNRRIIENRTSFYELGPKDEIVNATYVDNSYKWAGGGFISTTTDLIKFGIAHFEPGFLSAKTLAELTTSQKLQNGEETGYGIGWRRYSQGNLNGFGHSGGSVGGITQFRIFPEQEFIVVFLSNSSDTNYGNVVERIISLFAKKQEI